MKKHKGQKAMLKISTKGGRTQCSCIWTQNKHLAADVGDQTLAGLSKD